MPGVPPPPSGLTSDALPLSYRRLVGGKAITLGIYLHVTKENAIFFLVSQLNPNFWGDFEPSKQIFTEMNHCAPGLDIHYLKIFCQGNVNLGSIRMHG